MKTLNISDMVESLAANNAENLTKEDLKVIFMDGFTGYSTYPELEIIDSYLSMNGYPHDTEKEDDEPIEIMNVIVGKRVKYEVWQQDWDINVKEV